MTSTWLCHYAIIVIMKIMMRNGLQRRSTANCGPLNGRCSRRSWWGRDSSARRNTPSSLKGNINNHHQQQTQQRVACFVPSFRSVPRESLYFYIKPHPIFHNFFFFRYLFMKFSFFFVAFLYSAAWVAVQKENREKGTNERTKLVQLVFFLNVFYLYVTV